MEVVMRSFIAAVVVGPLMLVGALPAAHGQAVSSNTQTQSAAGGDSSADRDTYNRNAQDKIQEWQRKLDDFAAKTANKGAQAGTATENGLNKAWTKTQTEAQKLQTVGAQGWDAAKASFEKASRDLSDAWDKVRPKDN
jgi:hypothetical protein